jgi:ketosteroid isomerase-like protein
MENPNVESVKSMAEAFISGDLDAVRSGHTDDVVFHLASSGILSGTYNADEWFGNFIPQLYEETNGTFRVDSPVVAGDGDLVFLLCGVSRERNNRTLEQRHIGVYRTAKSRRLGYLLRTALPWTLLCPSHLSLK